MNWKGRVGIVTGASSGIGLSVARAITRRGGRPLDVTDLARLEQLPEEVVRRFGRLDVVVNNAGVNHRGAVSGRSAADLRAILDTNLVAPILLSRASLAYLQPGGAIVQVASLAGKVPVPDEATYSATKAGIRAFSRALGHELRDRDIHVATVCRASSRRWATSRHACSHGSGRCSSTWARATSAASWIGR